MKKVSAQAENARAVRILFVSGKMFFPCIFTQGSGAKTRQNLNFIFKASNFITSVRLIQVLDSRNDHSQQLFWCLHLLNRGVHLIEELFGVNVGILGLHRLKGAHA